MDSQLASIFLDAARRRLEQNLRRIRDCAARLKDEQIWARGSEKENAIGNLMLHLAGNVRQWILSGIAGKPDVRVREREFSTRGDIIGQDLIERLTATVGEAAETIVRLEPARLLERITVQGYNVTILEAIFHVVEHFAQHTGQIIFATKMLTHEDLGFYHHLAQPAHTEKTP